MVFELKLDHNSGLQHAKNGTENSSLKVGRFHRPFGGEKWGDAVAQGEMHFKVQN